MLRAIFLDVDGTLTGHAQKPVDPQIRDYLEALRAQGVRIGIATSHFFDEELTRRFAAYYGFDFMILESGSVIYAKRRRGGYARLHAWDRQHRAGLQHLRAAKRYLLCRAGTVDAAGPAPTGRRAHQHYDLEGLGLRARVGQACVFIRPLRGDDGLLPLIERLQSEARRRQWALVFVEPGKAFVGVGVATKGDAVRFLAGRLEIPLAEVCAVGDADNDVEMLSVVGLPACPADVTPELRALVAGRGGIVAAAPEYHGTREILRQLAQQREAVGNRQGASWSAAAESVGQGSRLLPVPDLRPSAARPGG